MQMNRVPQRKQTSKRVYGLKKCPNVDFKQGDLAMTEKEAENYLLENWGDIIQEAKTKNLSMLDVFLSRPGVGKKFATSLIEAYWLSKSIRCK